MEVRTLVTYTGRWFHLPKQKVFVPYPIRAWCDDGSLPYDVEFEVDLVDDRLACTELTCRRRPDGPAVTKTGVAALPLSKLQDGAFRKEARSDSGLEIDGSRMTVTVTSEDEPPPEAVPYAAFHGRRTRQANKVTDDELRDVAAVYREALKRGDPPTLTVAEQLVYSRATAGRRVQAARKLGYLGPAQERRKGEFQ